MFSANTSTADSANYIEDVFSTYLYTGTNANQTITNGIDLAGKGGLVWAKSRTVARNHFLYDTARGATNALSSDLTSASQVIATGLTAFGATGFTLGSDNSTNSSPEPFASWTFRKQPKFFDVVTYTGNGATNRQVSHSLGSVPGCVIVKRTDSTSPWFVAHVAVGSSVGAWDQTVLLNSTSAASGFNWGVPTSTYFQTGTDAGAVANTNINGATYVAYIFAHNAGGFGLTGTDNVISCGSFVSGSGAINLGYEPQWLLIKSIDTPYGNSWYLIDSMRGLTGSGSGNSASLYANTADAEYAAAVNVHATATGFTESLFTGGTYIYIAIRRGPMKMPTDGTKVFSPIASSASTNTQLTTNFPVDLQLLKVRNSGGGNLWFDRLRGTSTGSTSTSAPYLDSASTAAEVSGADLVHQWNNTGFSVAANWGNLPKSMVYENFRRAPGFFDEVCYTGTSAVGRQISHNLGVVPELMIFKDRTTAGVDWYVWSSALSATTDYLLLDSANAKGTGYSGWYSSNPTSTYFYVSGSASGVNANGDNYVAYLFATCPGVSKVGSYTGTGAAQTINCGFTAGARFVLIKRTDSTGDWYVWDTARGIISGNDPYLLLDSTAAEVTTTDYISPQSVGFGLTSSAPAALNASGGTYIYLAIA